MDRIGFYRVSVEVMTKFQAELCDGFCDYFFFAVSYSG